MMEWLRELFRTRYVALLEEEVDRLRAENRGLMNSLLGTAGFPAINFPDAPVVAASGPQRVRRRSWHQVQTQRELESAGRQGINNWSGQALHRAARGKKSGEGSLDCGSERHAASARDDRVILDGETTN